METLTPPSARPFGRAHLWGEVGAVPAAAHRRGRRHLEEKRHHGLRKRPLLVGGTIALGALVVSLYIYLIIEASK